MQRGSIAAHDGGLLYRNDAFTFILLDIPKSIEDAQGGSQSSRRRLISSRPVEQPFKTTDPKSERARQSCVDVQSELHHDYATIIQLALDEIHEQHFGNWCLERLWSPHHTAGKRTAIEAGLSDRLEKELGRTKEAVETVDGTQAETNRADAACHLPKDAARSSRLRQHILAKLPYNFLNTLSGSQGGMCHSTAMAQNIDPAFLAGADLDDERDGVTQLQLPVGTLIQNSSDATLQADLSVLDRCCSFRIPPLSTAVLATCDDSASLRTAIRRTRQADETNDRRKFDLILLDPPWPNRSAKRRGSYAVQYSLRDTYELLNGLDLDIQLAPGGYVAMWITNRAAVRDLVLGSDGRTGWLESLGVELIEEWIWIKTTASGQPVTALDGVWRKPYEILLVGKQQNCARLSPPGQPGRIKRRIIAAVPDLHSRKPCLKALFAEILFAGRHYQALEVFARYMVSGWWSWGDETIKYNWTGSWIPRLSTGIDSSSDSGLTSVVESH